MNRTEKPVEKFRTRLRGSLVISILGHASLAMGQGAHFPTNEEIAHTGDIRAVEVSPDGRQTLVEIADASADGGRTHLFIADNQGGAYHRLIAQSSPDESVETDGHWSPDGKSVYLMRKMKGESALYVVPLPDGQARKLDIFPAPESSAGQAPGKRSISRYTISPDGLSLAIVARDPQVKPPPKADAYLITSKNEKSRLFVTALSMLQPAEVPLPDDVSQAKWSPDSTTLVAVTENRMDADLGPSARAWVVNKTDLASPQQLTNMPKSIGQLTWGNTSTQLIYTTSGPKLSSPHDLVVLDLKDGKSRTFTDAAADVSGAFFVTPQGTLVSLRRKGFQQVVVKIDPATGHEQDVDTGLPVTFAVSKSTTGEHWAYLVGGPLQLRSVLYQGPGKANPVTVSLPATAPANLLAAKSQLIKWKNKGLTIEGMLYMPPQIPAGAKVPLVMHIHGGPSGVFQDYQYRIVNLLVGQGYAVLQPNIRGSSGYGTAFNAANYDDLGGKDFLDAMAGVDAVIKDFPVDPNRLAMIGYSYGGEMAGFIAGKTRRFKAIVSGAPVINQFSEVGTESRGGAYNDTRYYDKPWLRPEAAFRQSPISYAANVTTPMLLIQGEADETDPPGQSQEMYRALKMMGKSVELLLVPRASHMEVHNQFYGETTEEPYNGVTVRQTMLDFLAKYLK